MSTHASYGSSIILATLQISTEFRVSVTGVYDLNLPLCELEPITQPL